MENETTHPANRWQQEAGQPQTRHTALRLAAMAGHMRLDKMAARRAALIDVLADGCPHPRTEIWAAVAEQLGRACWGKVPQEALARDLAALRQGGVRIGYCRRPGIEGYYLQYPALKRPSPRNDEPLNWELVNAIGDLSLPEKNRRAFAAADFALRQKRLILAEQYPAWSAAEVDAEARRLVYSAREAQRP